MLTWDIRRYHAANAAAIHRMSGWAAGIEPAQASRRTPALRKARRSARSKRERVNRPVGGDVKSIRGGDQPLEMVQPVHSNRRHRERLAGLWKRLLPSNNCYKE
jgi:hypothetical protein